MESPCYAASQQQFAHTLNTPAMMISAGNPHAHAHAHPHTHYPRHQLTPPPTVNPASTTIKMEDMAVGFDTPPPPWDTPAGQPAPLTPPASEGKAAKKRKSWGQVLPEPKTNLPPRKRAKTDDEKEQRRIERVKRNRLAAHNSRERKRQEVEALQGEKDKVEADLHAAHAAMARMKAELMAYRQKFPGAVPEQPLDMATLGHYESAPRPRSDTVCPRQTSTEFPSPISMESDSEREDSCAPDTPGYTESVTTDFDRTRYPAAILCDLQCQSNSRVAAPRSPSPAMLIFLILFSLILSSTRGRSTISSTSTNSPRTTARWNLLACLVTLTFSLPSSIIPQTLTVLLTTWMQSTPTCRQPLAQLHMLATGLSQRTSSTKSVVGPSGVLGKVALDGLRGRRRSRALRLRQMGRRKGVFSLNQKAIRELASLHREASDTVFTRRSTAL
ncbi:hypothetical protein BDV95DRAFT_585345 [Massariosphaeria phaeospora]|uniref:BZIP domain-containing protein n=1 Tax=Massariosphaeria phaeospora TaxID=100035 RepID=A0A7C8MCF7_9PLEO|nr:hypothetical protein BDV95DRAFT_585345 [Massariosphaeria phaeospora]